MLQGIMEAPAILWLICTSWNVTISDDEEIVNLSQILSVCSVVKGACMNPLQLQQSMQCLAKYEIHKSAVPWAFDISILSVGTLPSLATNFGLDLQEHLCIYILIYQFH